MKLVINNPNETFKNLVTNASEIVILIAFLTESGIEWLPKSLYRKTKFIVGINMNITSKKCIQQLDKGGAKVLIYTEPKTLFHPKAFYFKNDLGEHLFIGSHNLTGSALNSNYEMSLLITKTKSNSEIFDDFQSQVNYLKSKQYCFAPSKEFYDNYETKPFPKSISQAIQKTVFKSSNQYQKQKKKIFSPIPNTTNSISEFIKIIAQEFPKLERKRQSKIKDHPLKISNDTKYKPKIETLLRKNIDERLTFKSQLNIGGNWYKIPNMFIDLPNREPWEKTQTSGLLTIQIHYNLDYTESNTSLVLLYSVPSSNKNGTPPDLVQHRIDRIREFPGFNVEVEFNQFHHWTYNTNSVLWSIPIQSYKYEINNMPTDEVIYRNLKNILVNYLALVSIV